MVKVIWSQILVQFWVGQWLNLEATLTKLPVHAPSVMTPHIDHVVEIEVCGVNIMVSLCVELKLKKHDYFFWI